MAVEVTCTLWRATEREIDSLIRNSALVDSVLDFDDPAAPRAMPMRPKGADSGRRGLHFLFTKTTDDSEEPWCYLGDGDARRDEQTPAHALRGDEVRRFAKYLSALMAAELARRNDPARLTTLEVSPDTIWARPASLDEWPPRWLLGGLSDLLGFVNRVAAASDGIIIQIA